MISEEVIYRYLVHLGVPAEMHGYKYLKIAVMLCLQNEEYIYSITSMLYPAIANQCMTTPAAVERCIRYAIGYVCKNTSRDILREYFGNVWNVQRDRLNNRKFIAGLVEYIKMEVVE